MMQLYNTNSQRCLYPQPILTHRNSSNLVDTKSASGNMSLRPRVYSEQTKDIRKQEL